MCFIRCTVSVDINLDKLAWPLQNGLFLQVSQQRWSEGNPLQITLRNALRAKGVVQKSSWQKAQLRPTLLNTSRGKMFKRVQEQLGSSCPPYISSMERPQFLPSATCFKFLTAFEVASHSILTLSTLTLCYQTPFQKSKLKTVPSPLVMSLSQPLRWEQRAQSSNLKSRTTIDQQILQQLQRRGKMSLPNTRASQI